MMNLCSYAQQWEVFDSEGQRQTICQPECIAACALRMVACACMVVNGLSFFFSKNRRMMDSDQDHKNFKKGLKNKAISYKMNTEIQ
jgi:hypothetical protein